MKRRSFIKILSACSLAALPSCTSNKISRRWNSQGFNTELSVTIVTELSDQEYQSLATELDQTVEQASKRFNLERYDSFLAQLNEKKKIEADPEFVALLTRCIAYAENTNGLFDVSVQPLWDWYAKQSKAESLDQVLAAVSYKHIKISANKVELTHPLAKLTLNGVVQGYLTDRLYQVCKRHGVKQALVNGGEYRAIGNNADGETWSIPVRGETGKKLSTADLSDGQSLAVSASYGYTFKGGENSPTASHIFHPSNHNKTSRSATVIVKAKTAELADVYATVLTLLPSDQHKKNSDPIIGFEVID